MRDEGSQVGYQPTSPACTGMETGIFVMSPDLSGLACVVNQSVHADMQPIIQPLALF